MAWSFKPGGPAGCTAAPGMGPRLRTGAQSEQARQRRNPAGQPDRPPAGVLCRQVGQHQRGQLRYARLRAWRASGTTGDRGAGRASCEPGPLTGPVMQCISRQQGSVQQGAMAGAGWQHLGAADWLACDRLRLRWVLCAPDSRSCMSGGTTLASRSGCRAASPALKLATTAAARSLSACAAAVHLRICHLTACRTKRWRD